MSTVAAVLFAYSRYNAPVKKLEMLFGVLRLPFDALAVSLALILSYHLRIASIDLIPGRQLVCQIPSASASNMPSTIAFGRAVTSWSISDGFRLTRSSA